MKDQHLHSIDLLKNQINDLIKSNEKLKIQFDEERKKLEENLLENSKFRIIFCHEGTICYFYNTFGKQYLLHLIKPFLHYILFEMKGIARDFCDTKALVVEHKNILTICFLRTQRQYILARKIECG